MPNAIVTASTDAVGERDPRRVAAHERDAVVERRAPQLVAADAQHRAGEIDADHARRAPAARVRAAIARSAVPVQRSSTRSRAGQLQRPDRAAPPAAIDAGAQQVIEEIVAAGDRVEHPRDALGRLGDRFGHDDWPEIASTLQVASALTLVTAPLPVHGG